MNSFNQILSNLILESLFRNDYRTPFCHMLLLTAFCLPESRLRLFLVLNYCTNKTMWLKLHREKKLFLQEPKFYPVKLPPLGLILSSTWSENLAGIKILSSKFTA
jgi:hypothetical protein